MIFFGKKIKLKKRYIPVYLILIFILFINSCMRFRTSDKSTKTQFDEHGVPVKIEYYQPKNENYTVRTISSGNKKSTTAILFIHGAPGSADAFYGYLQDSTLLTKAFLISYDRPGYGYSNFGESEISIAKQAEVVSELIEHYQLKNVILVGHSFGGPIAALTSLQNKNVASVLLLAPAIDAKHEKIMWIANFAKWKLTKWMVPTSLVVSADEKFTHVQELKALNTSWGEIKIPTVHIHGKKDNIVPFENLYYSKKAFPSDYFKAIILEEGNHFIPWKNKDIVLQELLKLLKTQQ